MTRLQRLHAWRDRLRQAIAPEVVCSNCGPGAPGWHWWPSAGEHAACADCNDDGLKPRPPAGMDAFTDAATYAARVQEGCQYVNQQVGLRCRLGLHDAAATPHDLGARRAH